MKAGTVYLTSKNVFEAISNAYNKKQKKCGGNLVCKE